MDFIGIRITELAVHMAIVEPRSLDAPASVTSSNQGVNNTRGDMFAKSLIVTAAIPFFSLLAE